MTLPRDNQQTEIMAQISISRRNKISLSIMYGSTRSDKLPGDGFPFHFVLIHVALLHRDVIVGLRAYRRVGVAVARLCLSASR